MSGLSPEQVFLMIEPVDMRLGIEGLSRRLQSGLAHAPGDGRAYVFRNRSGNRLKLLLWDGTGVWLCVRRLHRWRFVWPSSAESLFTLSHADWLWLTAGVDWPRLSAEPSPAWRV